VVGHFDIPAVGNKKQADSCRKIAAELGVDPASVVFVRDAEAELVVAAKEAGIGWPAVVSIRPGRRQGLSDSLLVVAIVRRRLTS
jgi:methionine salvage enolase-phosphatase E1